jgi:IclR family transcriptional regulator, acetate operon repressor
VHTPTVNATSLRDRQPRLVGSVEKALKVLHLFAEADIGAGLRVSDVAKELGVNKSTASRLLASLGQDGFLVADEQTRCYHVGPAAYRLGSRFSAAPLVKTVAQVLRDLSARTGCTSNFGMLYEGRVLFLAVSEGPQQLRVVMRPGDVQFTHASAVGKAILAAIPSVEADAAIAAMTGDDGLLPAIGPRTLRTPDDLRANLRQAARRGYSTSEEESTPGIVGIGAYVGLPFGIPTALSVAFPLVQQSRDERAALVVSVQEAAAAAVQLLEHSRDKRHGARVAHEIVPGLPLDRMTAQ